MKQFDHKILELNFVSSKGDDKRENKIYNNMDGGLTRSGG